MFIKKKNLQNGKDIILNVPTERITKVYVDYDRASLVIEIGETEKPFVFLFGEIQYAKIAMDKFFERLGYKAPISNYLDLSDVGINKSQEKTPNGNKTTVKEKFSKFFHLGG